MPRWILFLGANLLVILAITCVCFYKYKYFSEDIYPYFKESVQLVSETLGKNHVLEARLLGVSSFSHQHRNRFLSVEEKPQKSSFYPKNEERTSKQHSEDVSLAILRIYNADSKNHSLETTIALALVSLTRENYKEAIDLLEPKLKDNPKNVALLNTLAVAYLACAYEDNEPQDLVYALSYTSDAIAIDNKSPELLFNYALLTEKLFLKNTSHKAWENYLQTEKNPEWRKEAEQHLKALDAPTVAEVWQQERIHLEKLVETEGESSPTAQQIIEQYPNPARLYALENLIPEWGANYTSNNALATQKLKIARVIGKALAQLQDDNMISDMVAVIDRLSSNSQSSTQLEQLAHAHQTCKEGVTLIDQSQPAKSLEKLNEVLPIFSKVGDKASETHTMLHISRCERTLVKYEESLKTSSLVLKDAKKYNYPYLIGRGWVQVANAYLYQIDTAKYLSACRKAEFYLKSIDDWDDLTIVYIIFQSNVLHLRNWNEAFKYSYWALSDFEKSTKKLSLSILFSYFSELTLELKQNKVAILFYNELLERLLATRINTEIALAFQWKSLANYQVSNKKEALQDLNQAKHYIQFIEDIGFRSAIEQEINLELAEINLSTDPLNAIENLNKVASFFDKTSDRFHKTNTYLTRARAYLKLDRYEEAENDLKETIAEYENQRGKILEENNRISFFENMLAAYDEMIKLQLNYNKNTDEAFNYVEKSRARALLDIIDSTGQQVTTNSKEEILLQNSYSPLTIKDIQKNLPLDHALLEYKIFPDKLLIWVVQKEKTDFVEVPISENKLNDLIKAFRDVIQKDYSKEKLIENSDPLYKTLVNPIEEFISKTKNVIIIPDKFIASVPFSALINPKSNKFLIEEKVLGYNPSATIFIQCLKRDFRPSKENSILVVGNPTFTYSNFPGLRSLTYAAPEAKTVAKLYSKSELLLDEKATKAEFEKNLTKYNIIHFAGHALVDTQSSLSSLLVLASEPEKKDFDNEALFAYELYKYRFDKTKLVILAACQTANGQNITGEGVISIARPFLARGVPSIVASLWNEDDEAAKELSIQFHKNFLDGQNSLEALQKAQIALINSSSSQYNSPKMWATLILLGSSVKY